MKKEDNFFIKMRVIGDEKVGKSNLLLNYINGSFTEHYKTTMSADPRYKPTVINDKNVYLEIWDTPGQERFRTVNASLTINSFKNVDFVIVVFDITNKKSFETAREMLFEHADNQKIKGFTLIANKIDLEEQRAVSEKEINSLIEEYKAIDLKVIYTSAKTNVGVKEVFESPIKSWIDSLNPKNSEKKQVVKDKVNDKEKSVTCCLNPFRHFFRKQTVKSEETGSFKPTLGHTMASSD